MFEVIDTFKNRTLPPKYLDPEALASFAKTAGPPDQIASTPGSLASELLNHEYWGFDLGFNNSGLCSVMCWTDPIAAEQTHKTAYDNHPYSVGALLGLALTFGNGEVHQLHLKISQNEDPHRFEYLSKRLGEIAGKLERGQIEEALKIIERLKDSPSLMFQRYTPSASEFDRFAKVIPSGIDEPQWITRRALRKWLEERGVDCKAWGRGQAKGLDSLRKEIIRGESTLTYENGEVYLTSRLALLWVTSNDGTKRLIEIAQEFNDSRSDDDRYRTRRTQGGLLAEKMLPDEGVVAAAIRAIGEELNIHDLAADRISLTSTSLRIDPVSCFPGVFRRSHCFYISVRLEPHQERDLYIERGELCNTYFGFVPVPENYQMANKIEAPARRKPIILEMLAKLWPWREKSSVGA